MQAMKFLKRVSRTPATRAEHPGGPTKIVYLLSNELFRGLNAGDMSQIDRMTTMTTCRRGRVFYTPGESGEVLFVLKRGRVELYRMSQDGRRLVTGSLREGAVFGEMGSIGQGMYDTFAEAAEDCTLCVMSRSDVETLIATKPVFAMRLIELLGKRLQETESALERVAFGGVQSRLASLLLSLDAGTAEVRGFSHQELADRIGTHRETVTRCLNELRERGAVEATRGCIRLLKRDDLRTLADSR